MKSIRISAAVYCGLLSASLSGQVSYDGNTWVPQTGVDCSAFGWGSLQWGGSTMNTALGTNALRWAGFADNCVAVGTEALMMISTTFPDQVSNCTAIGNNAMHFNARGDNNTASGLEAMYNNSDGSNNTATGAYALSANTFGNGNVATGYYALNNNSISGGQYGEFNTAVGSEAMLSNTSGVDNTGIGARALYNSTNGNNNTAVGYQAMMGGVGPNWADDNTAAGYQAMFSNTSGSQNTAIGEEALLNNTSGWANTAVGTAAMKNNKTGQLNVGFGQSAIHDATAADANVGIGCNTLFKATAGYNIAFGYAAFFNLTGPSSTQNTAFAAGAGHLITAGNNLTMVGGMTHATGNYGNASSFGYGATVTNSNRIRLGNSAIVLLKGQPATWTPPVSDARFKYNLKDDDVKGTEFIMKLRPVTYNMDTRKLEDFLLRTLPDSIRKERLASDFGPSSKIVRSGFIAQEVEAAAKEAGYDFNGVFAPENETDHYRLCYAYFVVPLVKTVQEQSGAVSRNADELASAESRAVSIVSELNNPARTIVASRFTETSGLKDAFVMNVQPNPFSHDATLTYRLPSGCTAAQLVITDLHGKVCYSTPLSAKENSRQISSDRMPAGLYLYSIVSGGKVLGTNRVVITGK